VKLEIVLGLIAPRGFKSRILRQLPTQTLVTMIGWLLAFLPSASISVSVAGAAALAAVEAGKWGRVRPGRRCICDVLSSCFSMALGATDRNCRLLP
jgi:hypothetical protein